MPCTVVPLPSLGRFWGVRRWTQVSVPRFISARYVAMIGLRYFLSFMQNTPCRKHELLSLPFEALFSSSFRSFLFVKCSMFHSLYLTPPGGLPLKCKTCTNLNLFCGQIVWFRSFQNSRKNTPHKLPVYSLATFQLPFPLLSLPWT